MDLTASGSITIDGLCCSQGSDFEHLSPFKRGRDVPPPTSGGGAGLPGWAQGPPGSRSLRGLGMAVGQEGGKEVSGATFMCVLGVGEQEEGQETRSQPLPQLPFPPISAGHPHRRPGGPQFLSHLDGDEGSPGTGGKSLDCAHLRGGCGRCPPGPLQRLAAWEGCILPEAIPLPSGGKGQRKQRFWPR